VGTVGRWPWKSAAAKKRVTTYLSNLRRAKIEGGDVGPDTCAVGRHHGGWEGMPRGVLEVPWEQILEVVAFIQ
jgi:hypothetical protein